MKPIQFPFAYLSNYRPHKDKSVSISIETPELTPDEVSEVHQLHGSQVNVIIAPVESKGDEEILTIDRQAGAKSPSERLYNVIFAAYKSLVERGKVNENEKPFKVFYELRMDWHINREKQELE